jgi:soluble lytic murein transglycosylase-like protein
MSRLNWLQVIKLWCAFSLALAASWATAGSQVEEPLMDSVRTALSAAVSRQAPPVPEFASETERQRYNHWLERHAQALAQRVPEAHARRELLQTIWYESKRAALDPSLVLGLVEVESNFRKHAISSAGARGYMQVMPFWARLIGDKDPGKLFHAQSNLRFGCVILRHYLSLENGDLWLALGRYNGSRGRPEYPQAVLAAQQRWR